MVIRLFIFIIAELVVVAGNRNIRLNKVIKNKDRYHLSKPTGEIVNGISDTFKNNGSFANPFLNGSQNSAYNQFFNNHMTNSKGTEQKYATEIFMKKLNYYGLNEICGNIASLINDMRKCHKGIYENFKNSNDKNLKDNNYEKNYISSFDSIKDLDERIKNIEILVSNAIISLKSNGEKKVLEYFDNTLKSFKYSGLHSEIEYLWNLDIFLNNVNNIKINENKIKNTLDSLDKENDKILKDWDKKEYNDFFIHYNTNSPNVKKLNDANENDSKAINISEGGFMSYLKAPNRCKDGCLLAGEILPDNVANFISTIKNNIKSNKDSINSYNNKLCEINYLGFVKYYLDFKKQYMGPATKYLDEIKESKDNDSVKIKNLRSHLSYLVSLSDYHDKNLGKSFYYSSYENTIGIKEVSALISKIKNKINELTTMMNKLAAEETRKKEEDAKRKKEEEERLKKEEDEAKTKLSEFLKNITACKDNVDSQLTLVDGISYEIDQIKSKDEKYEYTQKKIIKGRIKEVKESIKVYDKIKGEIDEINPDNFIKVFNTEKTKFEDYVRELDPDTEGKLTTQINGIRKVIENTENKIKSKRDEIAGYRKSLVTKCNTTESSNYDDMVKFAEDKNKTIDEYKGKNNQLNKNIINEQEKINNQVLDEVKVLIKELKKKKKEEAEKKANEVNELDLLRGKMSDLNSKLRSEEAIRNCWTANTVKLNDNCKDEKFNSNKVEDVIIKNENGTEVINKKVVEFNGEVKSTESIDNNKIDLESLEKKNEDYINEYKKLKGGYNTKYKADLDASSKVNLYISKIKLFDELNEKFKYYNGNDEGNTYRKIEQLKKYNEKLEEFNKENNKYSRTLEKLKKVNNNAIEIFNEVCLNSKKELLSEIDEVLENNLKKKLEKEVESTKRSFNKNIKILKVKLYNLETFIQNLSLILDRLYSKAAKNSEWLYDDIDRNRIYLKEVYMAKKFYDLIMLYKNIDLICKDIKNIIISNNNILGFIKEDIFDKQKMKFNDYIDKNKFRISEANEEEIIKNYIKDIERYKKLCVISENYFNKENLNKVFNYLLCLIDDNMERIFGNIRKSEDFSKAKSLYFDNKNKYKLLISKVKELNKYNINAKNEIEDISKLGRYISKLKEYVSKIEENNAKADISELVDDISKLFMEIDERKGKSELMKNVCGKDKPKLMEDFGKEDKSKLIQNAIENNIKQHENDILEYINKLDTILNEYKLKYMNKLTLAHNLANKIVSNIEEYNLSFNYIHSNFLKQNRKNLTPRQYLSNIEGKYQSTYGYEELRKTLLSITDLFTNYDGNIYFFEIHKKKMEEICKNIRELLDVFFTVMNTNGIKGEYVLANLTSDTYKKINEIFSMITLDVTEDFIEVFGEKIKHINERYKNFTVFLKKNCDLYCNNENNEENNEGSCKHEFEFNSDINKKSKELDEKIKFTINRYSELAKRVSNCEQNKIYSGSNTNSIEPIYNGFGIDTVNLQSISYQKYVDEKSKRVSYDNNNKKLTNLFDFQKVANGNTSFLDKEVKNLKSQKDFYNNFIKKYFKLKAERVKIINYCNSVNELKDFKNAVKDFYECFKDAIEHGRINLNDILNFKGNCNGEEVFVNNALRTAYVRILQHELDMLTRVQINVNQGTDSLEKFIADMDFANLSIKCNDDFEKLKKDMNFAETLNEVSPNIVQVEQKKTEDKKKKEDLAKNEQDNLNKNGKNDKNGKNVPEALVNKGKDKNKGAKPNIKNNPLAKKAENDPKKMKNAPEALDNKAKPVDQEGNNADKPVEKKLTPDEIHKRNQELIKARQRDLKNNITNFIKSAYIKSINENINDKVNDDIIKTVCSKEQDNVNNLVNKIEDEFINKIKISEISDDGKFKNITTNLDGIFNKDDLDRIKKNVFNSYIADEGNKLGKCVSEARALEKYGVDINEIRSYISGNKNEDYEKLLNYDKEFSEFYSCRDTIFDKKDENSPGVLNKDNFNEICNYIDESLKKYDKNVINNTLSLLGLRIKLYKGNGLKMPKKDVGFYANIENEAKELKKNEIKKCDAITEEVLKDPNFIYIFNALKTMYANFTIANKYEEIAESCLKFNNENAREEEQVKAAVSELVRDNVIAKNGLDPLTISKESYGYNKFNQEIKEIQEGNV